MMNFVVCMMLEYLQIKLEYIMTIGKIIKHDFICFFSKSLPFARLVE